MRMGVIAEDDSDVAVIREVTLSLLKPKPVNFKKFVGGGSGKLRRKCAAWGRNLVQQGCRWIIVIHDLDVHNEIQLRQELEAAIRPAGARASVVLLPKREIETWLLYDAAAIAAAFRESSRAPLPGNPESLLDPKKHLRNLVWKAYRKEYLNTVHNELIAKRINLNSLRRSQSFAPHFVFADTVRPML